MWERGIRLCPCLLFRPLGSPCPMKTLQVLVDSWGLLAGTAVDGLRAQSRSLRNGWRLMRRREPLPQVTPCLASTGEDMALPPVLGIGRIQDTICNIVRTPPVEFMCCKWEVNSGSIKGLFKEKVKEKDGGGILGRLKGKESSKQKVMMHLSSLCLTELYYSCLLESIIYQVSFTP